MTWLMARRGALCGALGLLVVAALSGCSAVAPYLGADVPASPAVDSATATPPAAATSMPAASAAPSPAAPTRSPTGGATPASAAAPTPAVAIATDALGLVYARGTSVLQTGSLGGEAHEVALLPPYEAWAFDEGRLALAMGPAVEVIDLQQGTQVSLRVDTEAAIEFAQLHWGLAEGNLLHVAWVADAAAPTHGRRIELRALSPTDGATLGSATLPDVAGVTILRYDDAGGGTVALIPRTEAPGAGEVRIVDLESGETVAVHPIAGEGEAALSPDASQVVTVGAVEGVPGLWLHDLGGDARSRGWPCPAGTRPVSPVWSPDGTTVAFLLQPDAADGPGGASDLGVWVLNAASPADTLDVRLVMAETGASSALVGWTPSALADSADGGHIIGHHRGEGDDAYVFAVRPDGGDRRILNLGADAVVLGWMPPVDAGAVRAAIDPWSARFAQSVDDADMVATVVAEYVAAHADQPDEALSAALAERLAHAGWPPDLGAPQVRRLDEGLYVAQLPPLQICLLEGGVARRVATGHLVMDARRDGDLLGVIYGVIGAGSVQPMFVLLGRDDADVWAPRWSPQGRTDWIATDGEIRFEGEGVGTLHVAGTSFGIALGEADPFAECHACLHRQLAATWRRDGAEYTRQSALPADAGLASVLWEMTQPSPYAVVHEALRRARAGEEMGDLATPEALASLDALGLLAEGVRLVPEAVEPEAGVGALTPQDGVVRMSGEGAAHYRATVRDGRLVDVTIGSS